MELRDLEYFLACCEAGSFTAAARNVHIVQSAMSAAIARLEQDIGVPLFDRAVTPVAITEYGTALRASAQRVLDSVQAARDDIAAVSGQVRGTVVLGSTINTGPLDLAAVLAEVRSRHPGIVVHVRQSSEGSAGNLSSVLDGSMDIALTAVHPAIAGLPPGIIVYPLVNEPLVVACRAGDPLSRRPGLTAADLAGRVNLRFPPGWGVRQTVDQVIGPAPAVTEIADYALMIKLIQAGFGVTLMPASAIPASAGLQSVPVADSRLCWQLSAAVNARRRATAAATALLGVLTTAAAASPSFRPSHAR